MNGFCSRSRNFCFCFKLIKQIKNSELCIQIKMQTKAILFLIKYYYIFGGFGQVLLLLGLSSIMLWRFSHESPFFIVLVVLVNQSQQYRSQFCWCFSYSFWIQILTFECFSSGWLCSWNDERSGLSLCDHAVNRFNFYCIHITCAMCIGCFHRKKIVLS